MIRKRPGRWWPTIGIRSSLAVITVATAAVAQAPLPSDWGDRDLEGRWVAYRTATTGDGVAATVRTGWLEMLGRRGEFELLEWIAIYEPRRGGANVTPLSVLVAHDAPQWLRTAMWQLPRHSDSHNQDEAERALLTQRALAWSWIVAHGLEDDDRLGRMVQALRAQPPERVAVDRYLPPLEPEPLVLAWLDAPPDLVEFGDRLRGERGERYVHQVLRAIDGVVQGSLHDEPYPTKLYGLTEHAIPVVRQHAFLGLADLPPRCVPFARLDERLERTTDPAERSLVAMALGRSDHPAAALRMLDLIERADDSARSAAAQRLGDTAGPFGASRLVRRAAADDVFADPAARASRRLGQLVTEPGLLFAALPAWLERAAWARVTGDPRAAGMHDALRRAMAEVGADVQKELGPMLDAYGTEYLPRRDMKLGAHREAFTAAVREIAVSLRDVSR